MEPTFPVDNQYKIHGTNANSWHTKVPRCSSYVPYRCKQRKKPRNYNNITTSQILDKEVLHLSGTSVFHKHDKTDNGF